MKDLLEELLSASEHLRRFVQSSRCKCISLGDGDEMECSRCHALKQWDNGVTKARAKVETQ